MIYYGSRFCDRVGYLKSTILGACVDTRLDIGTDQSRMFLLLGSGAGCRGGASGERNATTIIEREASGHQFLSGSPDCAPSEGTPDRFATWVSRISPVLRQRGPIWTPFASSGGNLAAIVAQEGASAAKTRSLLRFLPFLCWVLNPGKRAPQIVGFCQILLWSESRGPAAAARGQSAWEREQCRRRGPSPSITRARGKKPGRASDVTPPTRQCRCRGESAAPGFGGVQSRLRSAFASSFSCSSSACWILKVIFSFICESFFFG